MKLFGKLERQEPLFTKQQFLEAKGIQPEKKDVWSAILDDHAHYTKQQVEDLLTTFLNKEAQ